MNEPIERRPGLHYEDFEVGQIFDHHWGRTMSIAESMTYSSMTMNYNPLYVDAQYAQHLGYTSTPINPLLVYSTILGLTVEDLSEAGGPFLGVFDLEFYRPVYDGDTVWARSETLSLRSSESRPGWGIAEWRTTGYNQDGEPVLQYRRKNLSRMKAGRS